MADEKISAMPAAGPLLGGELVPIVQTGVNKQTTVGAIQAGGGGGGPIWVTPLAGALRWQNQTNTSFFTLSDSGGISAQVLQTLDIDAQILAGPRSQLLLNAAAGDGSLKTFGGHVQLTGFAGGLVNLDDTVNHFTVSGFAAVSYQYIVGNAGDWAGSPVSVSVALDRIAAAVHGLLGAPIP